MAASNSRRLKWEEGFALWSSLLLRKLLVRLTAIRGKSEKHCVCGIMRVQRGWAWRLQAAERERNQDRDKREHPPVEHWKLGQSLVASPSRLCASGIRRVDLVCRRHRGSCFSCRDFARPPFLSFFLIHSPYHRNMVRDKVNVPSI